MNLNLSGRSCIVSGASAGIGAGIVKLLCQLDVKVIATARRLEALEGLADQIERNGGRRPINVQADITQAADVGRLIMEAEAGVGPIEILVNAAGTSWPIAFDATDDSWDAALNLNFTAARRLSAAVLPSMLESKWGRIINITGLMEPRSLNAASVAKGALHLWAKGLSCDIAAKGVTVNTIQPGRINSEQIREKLHTTEESRRVFIERHIPIGYFGEPEDIANLVAFLVSPAARYITGAVIPVDGGMHSFAH